MSDRIWVASGGAKNVHISAQDLLTCCGFLCGMGCNGGYLGPAWEHWRMSGLVSGGNYGSNQGCRPYSLPQCDHHTTGKYQPCGQTVPTPRCNATCIPQFNSTYAADKHRGKSVYSISRRIEEIRTEIMTHGPIEAAFTVFADFLTYKSGVYKHVEGEALGGHAVKILGWGTENGTPYWLVANSWNEDWGDQGFFKILRGANECGIEANLVAGLPAV